jgi:hypothetical protein
MKPSDFFIGVIDFFSVILPGALLSYFLSGMFYGKLFGEGAMFPEPTTEAAKWIVFLLAAYIVGNLIFMLASFLDATYDRVLRRWLFQSKYDLKFKTACGIREKFIKTDEILKEFLGANKLSDEDYQIILTKPNREIFNTFKWSQHYLLFNKPEALADIQRTEADSKFFRSLVVTFLIIAILMFVQEKYAFGVIFIVFAFLCYYRYGELRYKATEKAYEMIITFFYRKRKKIVKEKNPVDDPSLNPGEVGKPPSASNLRKELTADFSTRHREMIGFLTKGFSKTPRQVIIGQAEDGKDFTADKNEVWICISGHGSLQSSADGNLVQTILMPEAIVPMTKGNIFSVSRNGSEPLEILSLEN